MHLHWAQQLHSHKPLLLRNCGRRTDPLCASLNLKHPATPTERGSLLVIGSLPCDSPPCIFKDEKGTQGL